MSVLRFRTALRLCRMPLAIATAILSIGFGVLLARSFWRFDTVLFQWHREIPGRAAVGGPHIAKHILLVFANRGQLWVRWEYYTEWKIRVSSRRFRALDAPTSEREMSENDRMPIPLYIRPKPWPFYIHPRNRWLIGGYSIGRDPGDLTVRLRAYGVPLWLLVVLFGVWPLAVAYRAVRRRRRRGRGLCVACGYDLRASPEQCPECGTALHAEQPRSKFSPAASAAPLPNGRGT